MEKNQELARQIEQDLLEKYGPILSGEILIRSLGYKSADAFRQALVRKTIPVPVFNIEHRRGKFALTKDVSAWLAKERENATDFATMTKG